MHISAQFDAGEALTEDEHQRVHQDGEYRGTFFISHFIESRPMKDDNGEYDFSDAYPQALKEFLKLEPRAAVGKALDIRIIA